MSASRVLYLLFAVFALCSSINDYNSFNARRRINPNYTPERSDDRDREYSVNAVFSPEDKNLRPGNSKEKEDLYEAYNLLHTLAQDFHKPFDAPAVIVIGHQTSGKSALIEALMGFQFNQVGGGTKTRRPVALRMQYNPSCTTPLCFLTLENGKEEQRSLADIQAYIEAENKRLERDTSRSFDAREINIRMEYRYCPNMIVIDTPGMLHPPKGRSLSPQQKAHQQAAREAENLVLSKIRCQDYIILCVEDTTDWRHATTRNIVMQVLYCIGCY
jgi:GTPase SAR1 family protein